MKNRMFITAASIALICPLMIAGCDREVSRSGSAKINKDGSAKTEETVVKQAPDGTVIKEETTKSKDSDGETQTKQKTTVQSPDGTVTKEETKKTTSPPEVK